MLYYSIYMIFPSVYYWKVFFEFSPDQFPLFVMDYYSSTVFDSCIYSRAKLISIHLLVQKYLRLQHQLLPLVLPFLLQLEQLDFPVAHLENCKRISRWANWNSRWRHESFRWRHLDQNLWRWSFSKLRFNFLWWW